MNSSVPTFYFYYITLSHSSDVDSILVWREYYSFAETLGPTPCLPSLDMPSDTPHFLFSRRAGSSKRGFTLIELLVVIAIILVLAGITFGISRGVQNAQARTRAKAELAVIAQALEGFKSTYGDYPWVSGDPESTANAEKLLLALTGFAVLERNTEGEVTLVNVDSGGARKSFVDPTKLSLSKDFGNPTAADALTEVYFMDPWGNSYAYVYAKSSSSSTWQNFGYVLFSRGPDANSTLGSIATDGIIDPDHRKEDANIDNIYSSE